MAFYVYAWRDVRNADATAVVTGTKDVPRVESTTKMFYVEKGTDPGAGDLLIPIKSTFPQLAHTDQTWWVTLATNASSANLAANRANVAAAPAAFRSGKQYMQFGCGTGATTTAALAAIVWKNLV